MDKHCIPIVLSRPFEKLACEASRFWGNPALPEDTGYPMYIDEDGESYPYVFVCQINLEEIAPYDKENRLPHKGLLSFFAKINHYLGYFEDTDAVGGYVSGPDAVKVIYSPSAENLREVVLLDENEQPWSPEEMEIKFSDSHEMPLEEHAVFAPPTHREWETWDQPFEDWKILLQIDSFDGMDFHLNFMDCGVLDFLIDPKALAKGDFNDVRGIVLST